MNKLQARLEKLEGANPAARYTVIEHVFYEPSPAGPRPTGDVLRRVIGGEASWIRGACA